MEKQYEILCSAWLRTKPNSKDRERVNKAIDYFFTSVFTNPTLIYGTK